MVLMISAAACIELPTNLSLLTPLTPVFCYLLLFVNYLLLLVALNDDELTAVVLLGSIRNLHVNS